VDGGLALEDGVVAEDVGEAYLSLEVKGGGANESERHGAEEVLE
jgi:hypothetical protein